MSGVTAASGPDSWAPSGATRVAAVIGSPIRHSRSPAILNAAFRACDLDWAFLAFDVAAGRAGDALTGMRALGIDGFSVTMPHKAAVAELVDELTDEARALGAVNCVERRGELLVGHNTDGGGFVDALAVAGHQVAGRVCAVIGAGGAARAVVVGLARAGAAEVIVVNRTVERAEVAAGLVSVGRVGTPREAMTAEILVNGTSVGMGTEAGDDRAVPLPLEVLRTGLRPGQVVADLVYQPVETPLLRLAAACGATPVDGRAMLVHQAARAFAIWTGQAAPIEVMAAAMAAGW